MNLHAVRLWARSCFTAREHQEETITKSSVLKTKVRRKDRANLQIAEYYDNYFTPLLATRLT